MKKQLDIAGIGIGPFHLSLAALLSKQTDIKSRFFDQKKEFSWHSEIMFDDSVMQTSYLKDLVTPVDPTNPYSFLNYLVSKGLFYAHMNTGRSQVTRKEFEQYCQWVSSKLEETLAFNHGVDEVQFSNGKFQIKSNGEIFESQHLSVATGSVPRVPEFSKPFLSETCFHAKSGNISGVDLTGKRVMIIGGGQTGLEVFRNAFKGKWGRPSQTTLLSSRHTLEPLDESPFTNEYFTPSYVDQFYGINTQRKEAIVEHQKFASDGNTPFYLQELYNELYHLKHVEQSSMPVNILPQRKVFAMEMQDGVYRLSVQNDFSEANESFTADVVILCTGLKTSIPKCLDGLKDLLVLDSQDRFKISKNFTVDWKHSQTNKIFALNFGRHIHGISEPQTSLMAWRSGTIINELCGKEVYSSVRSVPNFTFHGVK